jgi:hypothetical protein
MREERTLEDRLTAMIEQQVAQLRSEMLARIEADRSLVIEAIGEGLAHHHNDLVDQVQAVFTKMQAKFDGAIKSRSSDDDKPMIPQPSMRVN